MRFAELSLAKENRIMSCSMLLVEDDATVLRTLKSVFESSCYEVFTAASAKDAVAALTHQSFDVVITDMRMETDTAGYEVVRAAQAQEQKPVIAILSAFPIPATEWRSSGADAMFLKGSGIRQVLDDLERLVRERNQLKKPPVNSSTGVSGQKTR